MKTINMIFTALATGLISAPSMGCVDKKNLSMTTAFYQKQNHQQIKIIVDDLHKKIHEVNKLTTIASELYFHLISISHDEAVAIVTQSSPEKYEHCELFIRSFEYAVQEAAKENEQNEMLHTEIVRYWKSIAKARYEIARLNHFVKQLTVIPKTFESKIDFKALRQLAKQTTVKVINGKYGSA